MAYIKTFGGITVTEEQYVKAIGLFEKINKLSRVKFYQVDVLRVCVEFAYEIYFKMDLSTQTIELLIKENNELRLMIEELIKRLEKENIKNIQQENFTRLTYKVN